MTNEQQEPRPYLGQRCHVEGRGFGTIVCLTFDTWDGEYVPTARVEMDDGLPAWVKIADVELLDTYPAG